MPKVGSSVVETAKTITQVFRLVWPDHKKEMVAFSIVAAILSFVPFITSGVQALLLNELQGKGAHGMNVRLITLTTIMVLCPYLQDILTALRTLVQKRLWSKITEFFELLMLKKRAEIDVATYEDPKFNDLLTKATDKGVGPICNLVERQFQQVTNCIQLVTATLIFLAFDWRFFVLAICTAIPDFIVELKYGKSSWDIWDEDSQTRRKYFAVRRHFVSLSNITELKIYQNVTKFYKLAAQMFKTFSDKQRKLDARAFKWRLLSSSLSCFFQCTIYFWTIWLVANGQVLFGTMMFLLSSQGRFQGALSGFFQSIAYQFEWSRYARDTFKFFATRPIITENENGSGVSTDTPPRIEFRNVSFAYPGTDKLILRDVNLTIHPGEKFALIGLNGAGKSTLIKLLMRFYDPTSGEILINGINLKEINRESWWSSVAALFQDYSLYNFPVREVIALGRSDGKGFLTKTVRSAKAVDAHQFIVNLSKRYDQMIGKDFDGGIDLSKGQNQKVALARAIYRDPAVIILDEPTASIDPEAESQIFARLNDGVNGRTQIIISHRFSTTRQSNRICVLEDGTISELGTHEELMANDKTYAKLFRLQAKGYE